MNKVTGINLNGNAYQLEEPGFVALSSYLAQAREQLAENPDQTEIMADLEQAIADKFRRFLSAQKSVILESEVEEVIKEMGPVGDGDAPHEHKAEAPQGPKRLFRIEKGEILGGVATGLAAYFNIDVVLVRLAFVALAIVTGGAFFLAYFIAWMVIPPARTQEEQAAASGAPFNAEEVIARAKVEYAKLHIKQAVWKKQWREMRKEHKRQQRAYWKNSGKYTHQYHHQQSAIGQLFFLLIISFAIWYGYHHVTIIQNFLDAAWQLWHRVADQIAQFIVSHDTH